jgi:hypothetical protein
MVTDPSKDMVTNPARRYGQNQNASNTTAATVVCITSGMSIVNRFIGSGPWMPQQCPRSVLR